jgi:hypothetical protein
VLVVPVTRQDTVFNILRLCFSFMSKLLLHISFQIYQHLIDR